MAAASICVEYRGEEKGFLANVGASFDYLYALIHELYVQCHSCRKRNPLHHGFLRYPIIRNPPLPPLSEVVWLRYTDGFRVDGENAELFGVTTSV